MGAGARRDRRGRKRAGRGRALAALLGAALGVGMPLAPVGPAPFASFVPRAAMAAETGHVLVVHAPSPSDPRYARMRLDYGAVEVAWRDAGVTFVGLFPGSEPETLGDLPGGLTLAGLRRTAPSGSDFGVALVAANGRLVHAAAREVHRAVLLGLAMEDASGADRAATVRSRRVTPMTAPERPVTERAIAERTVGADGHDVPVPAMRPPAASIPTSSPDVRVASATALPPRAAPSRPGEPPALDWGPSRDRAQSRVPKPPADTPASAAAPQSVPPVPTDGAGNDREAPADPAAASPAPNVIVAREAPPPRGRSGAWGLWGDDVDAEPDPATADPTTAASDEPGSSGTPGTSDPYVHADDATGEPRAAAAPTEPVRVVGARARTTAPTLEVVPTTPAGTRSVVPVSEFEPLPATIPAAAFDRVREVALADRLAEARATDGFDARNLAAELPLGVQARMRFAAPPSITGPDAGLALLVTRSCGAVPARPMPPRRRGWFGLEG